MYKKTTYPDFKQIEVGDFDGDGDLDIVVGDYWGRIFIFENKMPQKK